MVKEREERGDLSRALSVLEIEMEGIRESREREGRK